MNTIKNKILGSMGLAFLLMLSLVSSVYAQDTTTVTLTVTVEGFTVTLSPSTGFVTTITGEGAFTAGGEVKIYWVSTETVMETVPSTIIVEDEGTFVAIVTALDQSGGVYEILVEDVDTETLISVDFTVPDLIGPPGIVGPPGPQGPQGPKGNTGPRGSTGPMGPAGVTGSEGPQGEIGLKGENGTQGEPGPMGPEGPADGEQGPQGLQGETGPAGSQGEPGQMGPPGSQGDRGSQGTEGDRGPPIPVGTVGGVITVSTVVSAVLAFFGLKRFK